jgi:cobalt-zinc-cadmium efflux system outer membrane protein
MKFYVGILTGIAGVLCAAGMAFGQTPSPGPLRLSRQEAVNEALAHNPALSAAREMVSEAKAQITIATAIPDPQLVTEIDQERNFLNPGSGVEKDIGVQFTVPFPYRTHLNGNIARAGWKQAQYSLSQLQQQTASQTAQAYDAYMVAQRHRNDLLQSKDIAAQFLSKSEIRYRGGTVPKLDVLKAKVDLSKAENDLIANERAIITSRATLNRLMGRRLRDAMEATDKLENFREVPELGYLEQMAINYRPELLSMKVQRKAAHDSTVLSKNFWVPDLNLTLWRSYVDGSPDSYKFDGGISFPLFFWQHEKGAVAQAEHHELELKATDADLQSQILLDVYNSYTTATTAWRQAVYLRDQLLPEARQVFDTTFTSYTLGGSSALDLLSAKSGLVDAESQYTDALGAINDALADLERALGAPIPPSPTPPSHEK